MQHSEWQPKRYPWRLALMVALLYGVALLAGMDQYAGVLAGAVSARPGILFQGVIFLVLRFALLLWVPIMLLSVFIQNKILASALIRRLN